MELGLLAGNTYEQHPQCRIQSQVQKILAKPVYKSIPADAPPAATGADRLELSGLNQLVELAKRNDIRVDKVAAIKAQIEAGTYETEEKLNLAADRLLDDLME
jgi:anti-sigma28 factor (negative regulator of flagellin synthesis)